MSTTTFDLAWDVPSPPRSGAAARLLRPLAITAIAATGVLGVAAIGLPPAVDSAKPAGAATGGAGAAAALVPQTFPSSSGLSGLLSLPLGLQFKVNGLLGKDEPGYLVRAGADGPRAQSPTYGFTTTFTAAGPVARSEKGVVGLSLTGVGYGAASVAPAAVAPTIDQNEVRYARGNVSESYLNGPLGIAQTFTLQSPPAGAGGGDLNLSMRINGGLLPSVSKDGNSATFSESGKPVFGYRGLTVTDANHEAVPAHLAAYASTLRIVIDDSDATYPLTVDPLLYHYDRNFKPGEDGAGWSTAIGTRSIAVGSPKVNNDTGRVYFFPQVANFNTMYTMDGGVAGARYGSAVAITDTDVNAFRMIVGAPNYTAVYPADGLAHLYKCASNCTSAAPAFQASLWAKDGSAGDHMGSSVAIAGNVAVVGAADDDYGTLANAGSARVFTDLGSISGVQSWNAALIAQTPTAGDRLGTSVGISATNQDIVLGAPGDDDSAGADQGSLMIYDWVWPTSIGATTYGPTRTVQGPIPQAGANFGTSVAISGNGTTIVAGASGLDRPSTTDLGGAFVFVKGTSWTTTFSAEAYLLNYVTQYAGGKAGSSVGISQDGRMVVVGAPYAERVSAPVNEGLVFVFARYGTAWTNHAMADDIISSGEGSGAEDHFGDTLDMSEDGTRILIGTPFNTDSGGNRGMAEMQVVN